MTYKEERDEAAERCRDAYFNGDGFGSQESVQRPDLSFKAGADWALQSEVVRGLVKALEYFSLYDLKIAKRALEAYEQAVKEIEK